MTSKEKNLLINAVYAIVHFPIEQNLSATKTAYIENSSQFDHLLFIGLFSFSWCNDANEGSDTVKRQEKIANQGTTSIY